jgi:hypothetical protein
MSNDNYSLQKPQGFLDKLALKKRMVMFRHFMAAFPADSITNVLDVGVTVDKNALSSNYFEKEFPDKHKIIALSNQDARFLEDVYPGISFQLGDAKNLPFANDSIDVVFSSAVIEHLGCEASQQKMIAECFRVAKQGVFITTPNRWHPVEAHTLLPLIHWLPKRWHRMLLKKLGLVFYSLEENLNLLDRCTLAKLCLNLGIPNFKLMSIKTLGITSNHILLIKKKT